MALHPNIIRLREAHIPSMAYTTTLELQGLQELAEQVRNREFEYESNLKNYRLHGKITDTPKVFRAAAVLAKELTLSGEKVVFCTLSQLFTQLHYNRMERETQDELPLAKCRNRGYIVVADLMMTDGAMALLDFSKLLELGDYLASHLSAGGGLVIAGVDWSDTDAGILGTFFAAVYAQYFESHQIA